MESFVYLLSQLTPAGRIAHNKRHCSPEMENFILTSLIIPTIPVGGVGLKQERLSHTGTCEASAIRDTTANGRNPLDIPYSL